jgi:hypothetical protein
MQLPSGGRAQTDGATPHMFGTAALPATAGLALPRVPALVCAAVAVVVTIGVRALATRWSPGPEPERFLGVAPTSLVNQLVDKVGWAG